MNESDLSHVEDQDASEQLALILESLPVAVCRLTPDGSHDVLSITAGISRLSGFSGKEFLAKLSQDSTDWMRNEKIIQRDREWLASRVKVSVYHPGQCGLEDG